MPDTGADDGPSDLVVAGGALVGVRDDPPHHSPPLSGAVCIARRAGRRSRSALVQVLSLLGVTSVVVRALLGEDEREGDAISVRGTTLQYCRRQPFLVHRLEPFPAHHSVRFSTELLRVLSAFLNVFYS